MNPRSIVHIEIPATNQKATAQFYADLFGWSFDHMMEPWEYTMFKTGNTGGGYPTVGEHSKPGDVLVYVASDDIDADLKQAESLGGTIVTPTMEIPGQGWFGIFTDPTGNRVALWKALA